MRKVLDESHRENQNTLFISHTFFLKAMLRKQQLQEMWGQERPKNYLHLDLLWCGIIIQWGVTIF